MPGPHSARVTVACLRTDHRTIGYRRCRVAAAQASAIIRCLRVSPTFTPLAAAGLGIDRAGASRRDGAVRGAPAVADRPALDGRGRTQERQDQAPAAETALARLAAGPQPRSTAASSEEYDGVWARKRLAPYEMEPRPTAGAAWQYGERGHVRDQRRGLAGAPARADARHRLGLRPRTVLEVGCGNGLNLLSLACRFPEIRFAGVELTEGGFAVARAVQKEARVARGAAPFRARAARRSDARIARSSSTSAAPRRLPFADGAYDLVYSSLALEQMEQVPAAGARRDGAGERAAHADARALLGLQRQRSPPRLSPHARPLSRPHRRSADATASSRSWSPTTCRGEIWLQPCLVVCRKRGSMERGAGRLRVGGRRGASGCSRATSPATTRRSLSLAAALGWPTEVKQLRYREPAPKPVAGHSSEAPLSARRRRLEPARAAVARPRDRLRPAQRRRRAGTSAAAPVRRRGSCSSAGRAPISTRFDLVVTTPQYRLPERPNVLHLALPLHRADRDAEARAASEWERRSRRCRVRASRSSSAAAPSRSCSTCRRRGVSPSR